MIKLKIQLGYIQNMYIELYRVSKKFEHVVQIEPVQQEPESMSRDIKS